MRGTSVVTHSPFFRSDERASRDERTSYRSLRRRFAAIPLPEPHLAGLIAGAIMFARRPWRLTSSRTSIRTPGRVLSWCGLLVIGWAFLTVGEQFSRERRALVTTGPYAFSRNPMYVGWTLLYAGLALRSNNAWTATFFPVVLALTHLTVRREEASATREFGDDYRAYRRSVRRYL